MTRATQPRWHAHRYNRAELYRLTAALGWLPRRARLGFRERNLHFDIARYEGEVREDVAHAWSTEGVAKQD
jgi:hypothetical protein